MGTPDWLTFLPFLIGAAWLAFAIPLLFISAFYPSATRRGFDRISDAIRRRQSTKDVPS